MKISVVTFFMNLLFVSNILVAQNISGKVKINSYTFYYQTTLKSGGLYDFTVKNIEKADTDDASFVLAYNSQLQILKENNQIKETRIYAAKRNGAAWTISALECLRLLYDYENETINSQTIGKELPAIETNQAINLRFSRTKLTALLAIQTISEQFIKRYYKFFDLGKSPKITTKINFSGTVKTSNEALYDYEILPLGFGKDELSIRQAEKGLVYRTSTIINSTEASFTIRILYSKRKDTSWEIYSSDSWEMIFDRKNGKVIASKSSLFLPEIPKNYKNADFPKNYNENEMIKMSLEYFVNSYKQLF
jgi:hypothetical protein